MKILTINAGSSSLKFQLIDSETEFVLVKAHFDGIGSSGESKCKLGFTINGQKFEEEKIIDFHESAIDCMFDILVDKANFSLGDIDAVAHRIVHGGEKYNSTIELIDESIKGIENFSFLAPLHNPINIECVKILKQKLDCKHFGVFDTAFHSTIPKEIFLYALPIEFYEKLKIRKYGFHGTSHKFVANKACEILQKDINKLNIITCHLGNGQSITAIKQGKSFDTSMGFTPLDGLPMGTRSGSFDPEIIFFLLNKGFSKEEIKKVINKKSGLLGISKISNDMRVLYNESNKGNDSAKFTIDLLANRITKIIGAYIAEMNGVDSIIFTAGLGEKAFYLRKKVLSNFDFLGLIVDDEKNENNETIITSEKSKIASLVIPTNEELQMVREVKHFLK